jgi:hypothetical protein
MVGDEVTISCDLELINAGQKDLTMELANQDEKKGIF